MPRRGQLLFPLVTGIALAAFFLLSNTRPAEASPVVTVATEIAPSAPAQISNALFLTTFSFNMTCGAAVLPIKEGSSPERKFNYFSCTNMTATPVYVGGTNATTANSACISTDTATCAGPIARGPVQSSGAACITAGPSVVLDCWAGVYSTQVSP